MCIFIGISGDNTFQLEFVNSKGMESIVPISKVRLIISLVDYPDLTLFD